MAIYKKSQFLAGALSMAPLALMLMVKLSRGLFVGLSPLFRVLVFEVAIGFRMGLLPLMPCMARLMVHTIRNKEWTRFDSDDTMNIGIKPVLFGVKCFSVLLYSLVIAECIYAVVRSFDRPDLNIKRVLVVVGILATSCTAMFLDIGWIARGRKAFCELHAQDVAEKSKVSVPAKKKFLASAGDLPQDAACMICLSDFSVGEMTVSLRCGHSFHIPCIKGWLCRNPSCPLRCDIGAKFVPCRLTEKAHDARAVAPSPALATLVGHEHTD